MSAVLQESWTEKAEKAARDLIRRNGKGWKFTTDNIHGLLKKRGVKQPAEIRSLGSVMTALSREGKIEKTGRYVKSTRGLNNNREVAVWKVL
jgi:hypothetical protein